MEQLVSGQNATGNGGRIVYLAGYKETRKADWQEQFFQSCYEIHGKEYTDECRENPLLRLDIKYDCLSVEAQAAMYGYAKGYICGEQGKELDRKRLLTTVLHMGNMEAWKFIEEFTDSLLEKEWIPKTGERKYRNERDNARCSS